VLFMMMVRETIERSGASGGPVAVLVVVVSDRGREEVEQEAW
jgi:hypothetical protein